MKVLVTMVGLEGTSNIYQMDTIEHEGALWLVPEWIVFQDEGVRKPKRIIRLDGLRHQKTPDLDAADFVLNEPLPKALLDLRTHPQLVPGYVVKDAPDISAPIPPGTPLLPPGPPRSKH